MKFQLRPHQNSRTKGPEYHRSERDIFRISSGVFSVTLSASRGAAGPGSATWRRARRSKIRRPAARSFRRNAPTPEENVAPRIKRCVRRAGPEVYWFRAVARVKSSRCGPRTDLFFARTAENELGFSGFLPVREHAPIEPAGRTLALPARPGVPPRPGARPPDPGRGRAGCAPRLKI